ncbi:MAG: thiamine-phosphate kinase [Gammaproteobacteria bacterium]
MAESEFDIIRHYFARQRASRDDVLVGIGDDAALLQAPAGRVLAVCLDTLVAGVHFPPETNAAAIGHKALAVNLSDLAAMGAEPAWATLALTVPENDAAWLAAFSDAFFTLADRYAVQLVGGDTTRGPLVITVQAHGFVTPEKALRRQGARPGERIYVTGTLGDAGLALRMNEPGDNWLRKRLDFPEPRIEAGLVLRDYASAAIDISDGLLADLGHLLEDDRLGASLRIDALPRSEAFLGAMRVLDPDHGGLFHELPLGAGDDYELCFTVAEKHCGEMEARLARVPGGCRWIGVVEADQGIRCYRDDGAPYRPAVTGYQHFSSTP